MGLLDRLQSDMKDALRAGQKERLGTIRMVISELKRAKIDLQRELSEADELDILSREAKKRRESIDAYRQAQRDDLVAREQGELDVIVLYMPAQLSPDEARKVIAEVIAELGASSMADLPRVMKVLMPRIKGRFPGKEVKPLLEEALS
jgi:uncharacterized protein YqeY